MCTYVRGQIGILGDIFKDTGGFIIAEGADAQFEYSFMKAPHPILGCVFFNKQPRTGWGGIIENPPQKYLELMNLVHEASDPILGCVSFNRQPRIGWGAVIENLP